MHQINQYELYEPMRKFSVRFFGENIMQSLFAGAQKIVKRKSGAQNFL